MTQENETVLITGASSGIGEALTWIFARHGYSLILVARSADKLEQLADELASEHDVTVSVRPVDLAEAGSAESLARSLQRKGQQVDILVNNAGVLEHGAFIDIPPQDHRRMLQLNVVGLTDILLHFVPDMVARGSGRVLNVASTAAFQPVPSLSTYAATKAYVLSLSEALGEELRGTGVSVTTLCPGVTDTNMVAQAGSFADSLPSMLIGDVEKVAKEAYRACMKGTPIVVPGAINLAGTVAARVVPKWLMRRLVGVAGRSTL
jgi:short-subunit dehydrogenase